MARKKKKKNPPGTRLEFDSMGRPVAKNTRVQFDSMGRPKIILDKSKPTPKPKPKKKLKDTGGSTFNVRGKWLTKPRRKKDPQVRYEADAQGRYREIEDKPAPKPKKKVNKGGGGATYDRHGNIVKKPRRPKDTTSTRVEYDDQGRPITKKERLEFGPDGRPRYKLDQPEPKGVVRTTPKELTKKDVIEFDAAGKPTFREGVRPEQKGRVEYDAQGRPVKKPDQKVPLTNKPKTGAQRLVCLNAAGINSTWIVDAFKKMGDDPTQLKSFLIEAADDIAADKRNMILNAVKQYESLEYIQQRAKENPGIKAERQKAFSDMVSGGRVRAGTVSLEREAQSIYFNAQREFGDIMEEYRYEIFGLNNSKMSRENMIRIINGDKIDDAIANKAANAWTKAATTLMERFNRAGGRILKLKDWAVPMFHDATKITKVTAEEWIGDVKQWIDMDRLMKLSEDTSKSMTYAEKEVVADRILNAVYINKKTDNVVEIEKTLFGPQGKRMVANRYQEHRLLHFKTGDDWLAYSRKYGQEDYFGSMMGYLELMSKEIAAMEKFGPNPDKTIENIQRWLINATGDANAGRVAVNSYNNLMGKAYGTQTKLGDTFRMFRSFMAATKLGAAPIIAITDTAFTSITARFNDMPAFRATFNMMKSLAPSVNKDNRMLLNHLGFGAEYALDQAIGAARYAESSGYGRSARYADTAIRLSGLNYWTNAAKQSFKLEFLRNVADMSATPWGNLSTKFKRSLTTYGITPEDWVKIGNGKKVIKNEVGYFDPTSLDDPTTMTKVIGMVTEETRYAVPEPDMKTRGLMNDGIPTNTLTGEIVRTMGQFKAFPISVMTSHLSRTVNLGLPGGALYAAELLIPATLLGAVAIQAKELVEGRTMRDMDGRFFYESFVRSGVTGIIGDMIMSDPDAYGGMAMGILGPVFGEAINIHRFLWGSKDEVMQLELDALHLAVANGLINTIQEVEPRLWYTRVAFDRVIYNSIEKLADPNYYKKMNAMRNRMYDKGQDTWWDR